MNPSHLLLTRRKTKASHGTTAVITFFSGLILISLTLNGLLLSKRATDVGNASMEIRAVNVIDFQLGASPAVDVVDLSRELPTVDPSSNITTALCCRAMFGTIDFSRVALWVAYNRLLGFDHVFLWYHDAIADFPGFDELKSLPYVTLTPITGNIVEVKDKSQNSTNGSIIHTDFLEKATSTHWRYSVSIRTQKTTTGS
jgi:hypothetical protein